jgi:hypothetical protein
MASNGRMTEWIGKDLETADLIEVTSQIHLDGLRKSSVRHYPPHLPGEAKKNHENVKIESLPIHGVWIVEAIIAQVSLYPNILSSALTRNACQEQSVAIATWTFCPSNALLISQSCWDVQSSTSSDFGESHMIGLRATVAHRNGTFRCKNPFKRFQCSRA